MAVRARTPRGAATLRGERCTHTPLGPTRALVALPIGEFARAPNHPRTDLGRLERLAVPGARQAKWVIVGVEV
jgi:hypothetical protein